MSWTSGDWSQDDSVMFGYRYPNQSISATIPFDMSRVYIPFIVDDPEYELYPYVFDYPIPFNINEVYRAIYVNADVNFGYGSPIQYDPPRLGAFASTTALEDVAISISVVSLGNFAFDKSAVLNVTISPDCTFNPESTFPKTCEVHYYDADIFIRSIWSEWKYVDYTWQWVDVDPIILINNEDISTVLYQDITVRGNGSKQTRDVSSKTSIELDGEQYTVSSSLTTSDDELTITSNSLNWTKVYTDWIFDTNYFGFPHATNSGIVPVPLGT